MCSPCQAFFSATKMHFVYVPFLGKPSKFLFHRFCQSKSKISQINLCTWSRFIFVQFNALKWMGNRERNTKDGYHWNCSSFCVLYGSFKQLRIKHQAEERKKWRDRKKSESNKFGWAKQTQSHREGN